MGASLQSVLGRGAAFARIAQFHPELTAFRRDLHAHPELGFEEVYTSARVAEMLEVLRTDYIKFARARGLSNRTIHFGHALKNTLVPVLTITGLQLGGLIAFAIITETVFQWPGMGLLFIQAVTFADIPVMAAYLCLIALIFVVINLIVDLLYFVVDPRLRVGKPGGH